MGNPAVTLQTIPDLFARLGSVESLTDAARAGLSPSPRPKVNAHIHLPPNFSAFESVHDAVQRAHKEQVRVLCASNYYDYTVYADFASQTSAAGIFPLFGTEIIARIESLADDNVKINDPGNPGKIYVCGKGITRFAAPSPEATRILDVIRSNDAGRMADMIVKLADICAKRGVPLSVDEPSVRRLVSERHHCPADVVYLQERHIAMAFQEALFKQYAPSQRPEALRALLGNDVSVDADDRVAVQNTIRSALMKAGKPAFVPERFVGFEDAHRLILALGGIPCYPTLADGTSPICPFEDPPERLVANLHNRDVFCAEFVPNRNTPEVLEQYVTSMREAGIVCTAGTEHNTLSAIPIEPSCIDGQPIPPAVKDIFWEGACVVAAHQVLSFGGQPGYVTPDGALNPYYRDGEDRIRAFAGIGAAAVARFLAERCG